MHAFEWKQHIDFGFASPCLITRRYNYVLYYISLCLTVNYIALTVASNVGSIGLVENE